MSSTDDHIAHAVSSATSAAEHEVSARPPDLSSALRRRLRRRSIAARLMLIVGCLGLLGGAALMLASRKTIAAEVQTTGRGDGPQTTGGGDGPLEVGLPDGAVFEVTATGPFESAPPPRIVSSSPIDLHNECCPYLFVTFEQRNSMLDGERVDSWINEAGLKLTILDRNSVVFATGTVGSYSMEIRMPTLAKDQYREVLQEFSVELDRGFPVIATQFRGRSGSIQSSARLDFGAAYPALTLAESECVGTAPTHPVDADAPMVQQCLSGAGVQLTLQDSNGLYSPNELEALVNKVDVVAEG